LNILFTSDRMKFELHVHAQKSLVIFFELYVKVNFAL